MINGLIAAPMTAFREDGSVDLDVIPAYTEFLQSNGVSGVFVNGTTGEGFSLTVDERMAIAERWTNAVPAGLKIIVHVSHTCAVSTGELARHAAETGADGIGEMAPLFFKPRGVEELADHCAQTAAAAPVLPYYYYHMPSMSGTGFPMLDFLKAAEPKIPNLAGIKYTHEDLFDFEMCREFKGGKYDILHGRDETLLCALALGCRGAVGSTYNIMAPLYFRLIEAFDAGNLDEARRLQRISMKVIRLLIGTGNFFCAMKAVLKMQGLDMGGVRSPLRNAEAEKLAGLKDGLLKLGFFDVCSK
jgi:N-acetylneuraminate lyase